jgi:aromatic ring-cleaving dioxygenase
MADLTAPYHAHVYYDMATRDTALRLHAQLRQALKTESAPTWLYVGEMRDHQVGPHPLPQFEIHFLASAVPAVKALLKASGLTALVHPLTDDDLADHTTLAQWIGQPLALDVRTLDPVGHNKGMARFAKSDV